MKSFVMVDLNDPRTEKIAEVISNKTSKKIISLLSEKEMSESEIATSLEIPLNTVGYNVKKLVDTGFIEKVGRFLWSVKGKRVHKYRIVDRRIVISPKSLVKGIIPAVLISGAAAFGIKLFSERFIIGISERSRDSAVSEEISEKITNEIAAGASSSVQISQKTGVGVSEEISQSISRIAESAWLWFLAGALFGLFIYLTWNYFFRRKE